MKAVFSHGSETDSWVANPTIRYLRVVSDGRSVILALGYLEPHAEGDVEVWYSGTGEVVRMQNGRITGTSGLATDWREVRFQGLPSWREAGAAPTEFVREHDEMPGYRFGIREKVFLQRIAPPTESNLVGISPQKLKWFEESTAGGEGSSLPASRYAINESGPSETPMYGEQCLSTELCITWQRWPVDQGTAN